jgi:hypothetical protein
MNWAGLLELIADELGPEAANRVEARAIAEPPGPRLRISPRPVLSSDRLALVEQAESKEAAGGPLQDGLPPPAACAAHPVTAAKGRRHVREYS